MFAKKALVLAASAALAQEALAFNNHRHLHKLHKKDIVIETDVVVVTAWETVTVWDGQPTASPAAHSKHVEEFRPQRSEQYAKLPASSSSDSVAVAATSTSSSTSTSPPAAPTTLVTQAVVPPPASNTVAPAAPPPSPAPAAPPSSSSASTGATGGKRGLAYNVPSLVTSFLTGGNSCPSCTWTYNWDSSPDGLSQSGIEYVPMLWGLGSDHTSSWNSNANTAIAQGTSHLIFLNEPDNPTQSNTSPGDAASGFVQYMNSFSGKVQLGGPAITNSNIPGQGLDWLRSFMSECEAAGCKIDFCVTHWYNTPDQAADLFNHLQQVNEICNAPVWLTEFAPLGTDSEITSFLQTNLPQMDSLSYLERYAYFMLSEGALLTAPGILSSFGQVYANS